MRFQRRTRAARQISVYYMQLTQHRKGDSSQKITLDFGLCKTPWSLCRRPNNRAPVHTAERSGVFLQTEHFRDLKSVLFWNKAMKLPTPLVITLTFLRWRSSASLTKLLITRLVGSAHGAANTGHALLQR